MNKVRGKILKKLNSVRPIGYLTQDRVLQVNSSDVCNKEQSNNLKVFEPDIISTSDLGDDDYDDKENVGPTQRECSVSETEDEQSGSDEAEKLTPSSDIDVSSFRRPKLSSRSLFDPRLLSVFRRAVKEHIKLIETERRARFKETEQEQEPPLKARRIEETEQVDPLLGFPAKCPPGGDGGVIFYTTSLRGIRKTFENCNSVRFLLEAFRVAFVERDVSMHAEFREEMRRVVGGEAVPPKLFVKGRYLGGAEEVLRLHEQGRLRPLFEGVPVDRSVGPCGGCAGARFVVCFVCFGSRRRVSGEEDGGLWAMCSECNENGLLVCPVCC